MRTNFRDKNYDEKYDWILAVSGRILSITGIDLSKFYGTEGEAEEKLDDHMQKEIDYLKKTRLYSVGNITNMGKKNINKEGK